MGLFFGSGASGFSAHFLILITLHFAKSLPLPTRENQTPYPAKYYDKMMVCNLIQDSHVSEAITKLEKKLENLITLFNKSSTPQPKPPGKLT